MLKVAQVPRNTVAGREIEMCTSFGNAVSESESESESENEGESESDQLK